MEMETFKVCIFADGKIGRVWIVAAANQHKPCLPPGVVAAEVLLLASAACNLVSEPRCGETWQGELDAGKGNGQTGALTSTSLRPGKTLAAALALPFDARLTY